MLEPEAPRAPGGRPASRLHAAPRTKDHDEPKLCADLHGRHSLQAAPHEEPAAARPAHTGELEAYIAHAEHGLAGGVHISVVLPDDCWATVSTSPPQPRGGEACGSWRFLIGVQADCYSVRPEEQHMLAEGHVHGRWTCRE